MTGFPDNVPSNPLSLRPHGGGEWTPQDTDVVQRIRHAHAKPHLLRAFEKRTVQSFGVMSEENRQRLKEQVRISFQLSSQPAQIIYPRQIAALEEEVATLSRSLESVTASNETLLRAITSKIGGALRLHEGFVGVVSESSADQVTIMYNRQDDLEGEAITQHYRSEQFNASQPPTEGTSVEAYVFVVEVPSTMGALPRASMAELPSTDRFAGFREASVSGDVEM